MSAPSQITQLVHAKLAGRKIDVVGFVDGLLDVAAKVGAIRCCLADERGLKFEMGDQGTGEIVLDSARSKLRMLCARLGVLCNETPGPAVSLYGGEGVIRVQPQNGMARKELAEMAIHFKNTPDEHEFTITPIMSATRTTIA
jgi:hypothetical protein